jgi:hypothetical protein
MGQLLAILIIPPLVGLITYAVFRFIWEKDGPSDRVAPDRRLDGSFSSGGRSDSTNLTSA